MGSAGERAVFFFDIDNCLYSRSKKVHEHMNVLINKYFIEHLSLTEADAEMLHRRYYKEYGLAIEGLVRHHKVDPLEYNAKVDDALPMDQILEPNPQLRSLLESFDRSKVRLWLFTNAHITHGQRVVRLLGIEDCFEGITFCDYRQTRLVCKPHAEMFGKAEREAGVNVGDRCYFVDDSYINCEAAEKRGWTTVHKIEQDDPEPKEKASKYLIRDLEELRTLFPHLFKEKPGIND